MENSVVEEPKDCLDIRTLGAGKWLRLALFNNVVWYRGGELRTVPREVILNALHVFNDEQRLVDLKRIPAVPEEYCLIHWEQCKPVMQLTEVKAVFNPGPRAA